MLKVESAIFCQVTETGVIALWMNSGLTKDELAPGVLLIHDVPLLIKNCPESAVEVEGKLASTQLFPFQ